MKNLFITASVILLFSFTLHMKPTKADTKSFYEFVVTDINGEDFNFETLKGKRVLIVNTASKCGYTPQYADLQKLYDMYGGDNFEIIGFPCNDFGGQEPGSEKEIESFCKKNYGVTFPMMAKVSVKGKDQSELYSWLTNKELNGVGSGNVNWNFHKFLIDEKGNWVKEIATSVSPLDPAIVAFAKGE